MPRILRLINRLNVGGPTLNVAMLTKHLSPKYETLVVSGMKDDSEADSEFILHNLGIQAHYLRDMYRNINPFRDYPAYRELRQLIRRFRPDIVHTHAAKAGALGRLAAYHCGVPVIVHTFHGHVFHSYFGAAKTQFYLSVERYLAQRSSRIIAISEGQKRELSEKYRICAPEHIEVVRLGFDLSKFYTDQSAKRTAFRQQYQLDNREVAIGIVGRLVPVKNHTLFLSAIAQLRTQTPFRAFIIGDGELKAQLAQQAEALGIGKKLVFTSWIKDIDRAYAGLDIVALSSLNEGTPVSLIEAQAAARPVVATDVGGVRDIIAAQADFVSSSQALAPFTEHLQRLVDNEALRLQLGQLNRAHIDQQYSYTRLVADMEGLYEKLLNK
ncbi:MAG: glycosyltransferase [Sphingobacteriales bacterium]|nr:glycosyltransferase [Sphingobacteriales bacterium]